MDWPCFDAARPCCETSQDSLALCSELLTGYGVAHSLNTWLDERPCLRFRSCIGLILHRLLEHTSAGQAVWLQQDLILPENYMRFAPCINSPSPSFVQELPWLAGFGRQTAIYSIIARPERVVHCSMQMHNVVPAEPMTNERHGQCHQQLPTAVAGLPERVDMVNVDI